MAAVGATSFGYGAYPVAAVAEPRMVEERHDVDLLSDLQRLEREDIRMARAEDGNTLLYHVRSSLNSVAECEESLSDDENSYSSDSIEDISQCVSYEDYQSYYRHEDKERRIDESISRSCTLQFKDFKELISKTVKDVAHRYGYHRYVVYEQVIYIALEDQERKIRKGGLKNNLAPYIENLNFLYQMAEDKNCGQLVLRVLTAFYNSIISRRS